MRRAALLLVLVLLSSGCEETTTVPAGSDPLAAIGADQVLYQLRHVMTRDGVRKADLHADSAYFREAKGVMELRGVRLEFFDEATGGASGTLTSTAGEYDMGTGAMTARGDAVLKVEGPEGTRTIESEVLHFEIDADRVWSDRPTVMREAGRVVRGSSFESDTKFSNVRVESVRASGPVEGTGIRF